jgi:hypothetical protein
MTSSKNIDLPEPITVFDWKSQADGCYEPCDYQITSEMIQKHVERMSYAAKNREF